MNGRGIVLRGKKWVDEMSGPNGKGRKNCYLFPVVLQEEEDKVVRWAKNTNSFQRTKRSFNSSQSSPTVPKADKYLDNT